MAIGLGRLALAPAAFWGMTPRELAAALAGLGFTLDVEPPPRAALAALLERFPDRSGRSFRPPSQSSEDALP